MNIIYKSLLPIFAASLIITSCNEDVYSPTLPLAEGDEIAEGQTLDPDVLFGIWEGSLAVGEDNTNHFEQTYRVEFQSVDDAEAILSHWYVDASTSIEESLLGMEYNYSFDGTTVLLSPKTAAAQAGANVITAVYVGSDRMKLYSSAGNITKEICTLTRTGDPEPAITGVNRTLPQPGEVVTFTGRNLQFVDQIYLPTESGELEVKDFASTSRQIQFTVPDAEYAAGNVRFHSDGAHMSAYSQAMFCYNCVFFKDFSTNGTKAPYTGTEFENTIDISQSLLDNVTVVSSDNLPDGHALTYATSAIINPETMICFFGNTPVAWDVDSSLDPSTGYMRFSFGDRAQYVVDNSDGLVTASSKCKDVAIEMDIYVYSDGQPVWNTGFMSFRLDKDQGKSLTASWFGQTAMWDIDEPVSFEDGWKTYTIPLSEFKVTENDSYATIGNLMNYLKSNKKQTIIKLLNYQLDALHPAQRLDSFQMCVANMRLVPSSIPDNKSDDTNQ